MDTFKGGEIAILQNMTDEELASAARSAILEAERLLKRLKLRGYTIHYRYRRAKSALEPIIGFEVDIIRTTVKQL